MNRFSSILILALSLLLTGAALAQVAVVPSHGDGSPGDPYQIASLGNLHWIAADSNRWSLNYRQTADIDATDTVDWNGGEGFLPIGRDWPFFSGSYDGQGHTIDGLFINRPATSGQGFFGFIDSTGVVSNLGLINVNITGNGSVGGLAGECMGAIVNCYTTGAVTNQPGAWVSGGLVGSVYEGSITGSWSSCVVTGGALMTGGLVGRCHTGSVSHSHATGNVTSVGGESVGGLIGLLENASPALNCFATGAVNGHQYVGGLVGYADGDVSNCYAIGVITSTWRAAGGLIGSVAGSRTVSTCFATGAVNGGESNVGGLIGSTNLNTVVTDCYATGAVHGVSNYIGGLIGFHQSSASVINCYATGEPSGGAYVGGLLGYNNGSASNCFWNTDVFATPGVGGGASTGIMGLNVDSMRNMADFTGWNFPHIWTMSSLVTFNAFPTLTWTHCYAEEPHKDGSIYLVENIAHLVWIADHSGHWDNSYRQIADVDATITRSWDGGAGWTPIGQHHGPYFSGSYDGQGHTIDGLFINRPTADYQGLFGNIYGAIMIGAQKVTMQLFRSGSTQRLECLAYVDLVLS